MSVVAYESSKLEFYFLEFKRQGTRIKRFITELSASNFFSATMIVLGLQQIDEADDLTGAQHPSKLLNSLPMPLAD